MAQVIVKGLRKMYHDDVSQYLLNLQRALRINRMYSKTIYINFKRSVDGDAIGYCSGDKSIVEIELSKQYSHTDLMIALAHEMVHAKQFFRKELIDGFYLIRKNKSIQSSYSYECKTCTIARVKRSKNKISNKWEYPDW